MNILVSHPNFINQDHSKISSLLLYNIMLLNPGSKLGGVKPKKKTTTEIICDNLGLSNQTIFQDYKCTLKSNFSYFGRLYVGEEHLMFVSNMFGIVKKTAIVIDSISKISQPSADSISIFGKAHKLNYQEQFIFSGFKNDNAFRIIKALWKKQKLSSEVLNANNDQENEGENKPLIGLKSLDDANVQINLFNPDIVESQKQKMLQVILPCSVQQFYKFFLADEADVYPRGKHLELKKATKLVTTSWRKNEQLNAQVRQLNALLKVKGVPFKSQAGMSQVWLLTRAENFEMTLKVITQMADVPFSSNFTCEEHSSITREGDTKCKYVCEMAIVFNKATYMKNTILSRTFEDLKEDYKMWSDNVKEILQKMKKKQEDDAKNADRKKNTSNLVSVEYQTEKMELQKEKEKTHSSQHIREEGELIKDVALLKQKIDLLTKLVLVLLIVGIVSLTINIINCCAGSNDNPVLTVTEL